MVAVLEKRSLRDFDWLIAVLAIAIVCFGVWQIYNAPPNEGYWSKQIIGLFIALIAFAVVAASDYRRIVEAAPFFYVVGLVLLLLVLTPLGVKSKRSTGVVKTSADRTISTVGICENSDRADVCQIFRREKRRNIKIKRIFDRLCDFARDRSV